MGKKCKNKRNGSDKTKNETDESLINVKVYIQNVGEPITARFSSVDTVSDVKQLVLERHDCFFRTCIAFQNDKGSRIDDLVPLGSLCDESKNATLRLVDKQYTLKDIMIHLTRLNETMIRDSFFVHFDPKLKLPISLTSSLMGFEVENPNSNSELSKIHINDIDSLSSYYYNINQKNDLNSKNKFYKYLRLSFYNPPMGVYKINGFLLYLEVLTLEDQFFGITCSVDGFYINKSTISSFDPSLSNSDQRFNTIEGLLSSISSSFKKKMKESLKNMYEKHPYECFVVNRQVHNWLGLNFSHSEDFLRSIEHFLSGHVLDEISYAHIRDWNDELQSVKGVKPKNENESIDRHRCLYKILAEITECSTRAATYAIDSRLSSINDSEDERLKMFIWNNLFVSFACESKDHFKDFGGEVASFIAPSLDIRAINYLMAHDIEDLNFLGTTVVDYRGFRLVVQTILPGIFNRTNSDNVEYGSLDHGKTVFKDSRFDEVLSKVASLVNSNPSIILDSNGQPHELALSVETKGVIGLDSRKYLIELYRLFPPDPLFISDSKILNESSIYSENVAKISSQYFKFPTNYPHRLACFRPELIDFLKRQTNMRKLEKLAQEHGDPEVDDLAKNIETKVIFTDFNPDCFENKLSRPKDSLESAQNSRECLRNTSLYLINELIPAYVKSALNYEFGYIFDHTSLTKSLHLKGINIRYIGYIASLIHNDSKAWFLLKVINCEMICRAAKRIFRSALLRTIVNNTSVMISHFLNCFLSSNPSPKVPLSTKVKIKKCNSIYKINWDKLTPSSLWKFICDDIKSYYGYNLNIESVEDLESFDIKRVSLLKNFCQMAGIEILLKDYDFTSKKSSSFVPLDVIDTFPIVKSLSIPIPKSIKEKLEQVQVLLTIPTQVTYIRVVEELQSLISYFIQNYGGMLEENASAHATLARVYATMGDYKHAAINQSKAVVILERIMGLDHYLTITSYFQLAIYLKGLGNKVGAVNILHRVRYLVNLAYGLKHPFVYEIERNLLALLFDLHDTKLSMTYAESIIDYIHSFDSDNLKSLAEIHQIISAILFNNSEYRLAFNQEKKAYQYLSQIYEDKENPALKSCQNLLDLYLKSAISHEKVNQNKRQEMVAIGNGHVRHN